jgi:hypothetical protein
MRFLLALLLRILTSPFRSHFGLEIEVLVLRQQLAIYQRSVLRLRALRVRLEAHLECGRGDRGHAVAGCHRR